jgi:hypothetical protein
VKTVRNISDTAIAVRDRTQPGDEEPPQPTAVKPGKTVDVSDDKAHELVRDYPEHFEVA